MATRYCVTWTAGGARLYKGFAFRAGALRLWRDLVNWEQERDPVEAGCVAYLGRNGERWEAHLAGLTGEGYRPGGVG